MMMVSSSCSITITSSSTSSSSILMMMMMMMMMMMKHKTLLWLSGQHQRHMVVDSRFYCYRRWRHRRQWWQPQHLPHRPHRRLLRHRHRRRSVQLLRLSRRFPSGQDQHCTLLSVAVWVINTVSFCLSLYESSTLYVSVCRCMSHRHCMLLFTAVWFIKTVPYSLCLKVINIARSWESLYESSPV